MVGAHPDDDNGEDSGSAYVFRPFEDSEPVPVVDGMGAALLALIVLCTGTYAVRRRKAN